jgi:hypothetical protein
MDQFRYLKDLAQRNDMTDVVNTLNQEAYPDFKDICDKHLAEEAQQRYICIVKVKTKRKTIKIANQYEYEWSVSDDNNGLI